MCCRGNEMKQTGPCAAHSGPLGPQGKRSPAPRSLALSRHFLEWHRKCHLWSFQESGAQATHMYIYNFLGFDYRPTVTFTANFLLIRCCSSSAKWTKSQTGALKFKNATDDGANRSWMEKEGAGSQDRKRGRGRKYTILSIVSAIMKVLLTDLIKALIDCFAENVSNACLSG